jgi:nucleoside-diphosphate-sugar epimerase
LKKILVTGKSGYIATEFSKLIGRNYNEDYEVTQISLRSDWESENFGKYDVILHAAGLAHRRESSKNKDEYFEVNRDLTYKLANKSKRDGCEHFIFISSMSVFGIEEGIITSQTQPMPNTNYGLSKLEAENLLLHIQDSKFRVAILRPPMVYGRNCVGNYNKLSKLADSLPIFIDSNNFRSMIYVENLISTIKQIIDNNSTGIFYPQNVEYINTSQLVKTIREIRGKKTKIIQVNKNVKQLILRVDYLKKIFGTLVYDKNLSSENIDNKELIKFKETIKLSEE